MSCVAVIRKLVCASTIGGMMAIGCSPKEQAVTALQLVEFSEQFDGARVVVSGQVQDVHPPSAASADRYTVFVLADGTARATVFTRDPSPINRDDRVEVRGTYRRAMRVGSGTLYDMVEASSVRRLEPATAGSASPAR